MGTKEYWRARAQEQQSGPPPPEKCEECGVPHGSPVPPGYEMPGRETAVVEVQPADARNHAARNRALCSLCRDSLYEDACEGDAW